MLAKPLVEFLVKPLSLRSHGSCAYSLRVGKGLPRVVIFYYYLSIVYSFRQLQV